MNSSMKTALPIGLVVLMVFGVTFMSQFTAPPAARVDDTEPETELPLKVVTAEYAFDPAPRPDLWFQRFFPGFLEVGTDGATNRIGFIIRNARRSSVFLTALRPSCPACTTARAAVLPPADLANYFQHVAAGTLVGPAPAADLLSAIAWASLRPKLAWHEFAFNEPTNKFELPGAAEQGDTWGLLELGFAMTSSGAPTPKQAYFDLYDAAGSKLTFEPQTFTVVLGGRDAQELTAVDFRLPELSDSNPTHTFDVYVVSATRQQLPPPPITTNNDSHLRVGQPVPIGVEDLQSISKAASARAQSNGVAAVIPYKCGYRIPISLSRDANGKSLDVGPYERILDVGTGPGIVVQKPARVRVRGEVVGAVRLEGASSIDFGSYNGDFAQKKEIRLWTEKKDVMLEVDPKLCEPGFLKPTLGAPTPIADRLYWTLTVQIPAKEGKRPPWEGSIYLRAKGEKPFNMRIHTSGHGR
ncbi:MAG: hypothetical protein KF873_01870 [Gemmataceae bacterium]|nr:hypothetical protein [Gemmataceae bacterium]